MEKFIALAIVVILIVSGFYALKKIKKAQFYGPFALYHTRRGIKLIERIANFCPRFWKAFSTFGILLGFFFMIMLVYSLFQNTLYIFKTPGAPAGAALAIPGVTIPFWGGIIGIIVLLVVHEFSHGIISVAEKIRLTSAGTLSLGFLPLGAFVNPSKKGLEKARTLSKLRIFAAGSFMNIVVCMLFLLLLVFLVIPTFTSPINGIYLLDVEKGSPAEKAGLEKGMILLTEVNGEKASDWVSFYNTLTEKNKNPGSLVRLSTSEKTYTIKTIEKEGRSYIGISFCGSVKSKTLLGMFFAYPFSLRMLNPACYPVASGINVGMFWFVYGIFIWIIILNYGVGLVNLLPLKPFDGGLMMESVFQKIIHNKKIRNNIVLAVSAFSLFLLLANVFGQYFWKIFV